MREKEEGLKVSAVECSFEWGWNCWECMLLRVVADCVSRCRLCVILRGDRASKLPIA